MKEIPLTISTPPLRLPVLSFYALGGWVHRPAQTSLWKVSSPASSSSWVELLPRRHNRRNWVLWNLRNVIVKSAVQWLAGCTLLFQTRPYSGALYLELVSGLKQGAQKRTTDTTKNKK